MSESTLVASIAIAISILSLVWNWRHSESLFRRSEYPAVPWHLPKIIQEGHNTTITTSIRNFGPKGITAIFMGAFMSRGLKVEGWCKSEAINELPTGEELVFTLTTEFEKDVSERFGGLIYNNGWFYQGKPRKYKIILRLEYLPLIANTTYFTRKAYYLAEPTVENSAVKSWNLRPLPTWLGWLPWL